jgi:major membrane immunogen (membrane-anchored lipoprotein)
MSMKRPGVVIALALSMSLLACGFAMAADDSKVKNATNQVESGAKKIPDGKVGEGVAETAKGIGKTVSEGAKYSGEKLK